MNLLGNLRGVPVCQSKILTQGQDALTHTLQLVVACAVNAAAGKAGNTKSFNTRQLYGENGPQWAALCSVVTGAINCDATCHHTMCLVSIMHQ